MAQCAKCKHVFVPDFMWVIPGQIVLPGQTEDKECVFCKIGQDYITVDKLGIETRYTKKEATEDYKKFLRMLADKPSIAKRIMDAGVNDLKNERR